MSLGSEPRNSALRVGAAAGLSGALRARYVLGFLCCSPASASGEGCEGDSSRSADSAASGPAGSARAGPDAAALPRAAAPGRAGPCPSSGRGAGPGQAPPLLRLRSAPGWAALSAIATLGVGEGLSAPDLLEIRPGTKWKLKSAVGSLLTPLLQLYFVLRWFRTKDKA